MNRVSLHALLLFFLGILIISCKEDEMPDPDPTCVTETYDAGLYISNEGPFSNGSGSITYYNTNSGSTVQNSFSINNCDEVLGSIVQSISTFDNKAYIVVNNANKIIVADAATLEQEAVVEDLVLPRYFLPVGDDKAFISQWGDGGVNGSIAVLDLNTNTISKTIPCGVGPENMIRIDNQVYVANNGGFGRDSTVAIIDIATESLVKTFVAGNNPHSFVIDNINQLWCLSSGYNDFYDPSQKVEGQLSLIDGDQVSQSLEVPQGAKWLNINNAGNQVYYIASGGAYTMETTGPVVPSEAFIAGNFYSMAINFNTDQIYLSDEADFASVGKVFRYDSAGQELESIDAGIIPGGFWFD